MSEAKFLPPKQNALLTRLIQSIFYLVMYFVYQIKLEVSDRDIALLKEIDNQRVVYLPNHSNLDDGLVMFLLSARLGQLLHYIVAYEAFSGFVGWLMQAVGAYSIRRGMGDRLSIVHTLKILQQPKCKLVVFPEGGCSYQNDTVMPFRTGGIELAFKAIAKLSKKQSTIPDLYFVPVSIKYCYLGNWDRQIAQSLGELETALSIQPTSDDLYSRLRGVSAKVLTNLETEYHITLQIESDWNQRIANLKQHLLNYCEERLKIAPATQLPNRERVYKIQSILADAIKSNSSPELDYQHLKLTTVRLLNFDAIYDGYVADEPTNERFFATLDRLEREVFQIDRPKPKGLRRVRVKIDSPIAAREYWQHYQADSTQAIANLTQRIQQKVQANLNSSRH
ncbi:1-acyl-sn-glycerol-3-phosphate acyltransferase [Waterburya agarophytonicola K14]|uniref:1-acyl-sn-glycerol-3-phosphate acyltransferase n=1 Tax=Waterburya agarophytonicola KI4 TaxID=2874699 RepID=A0A964FDY5_9CYAN|nr:1-acyl-sn-glycerol-3-phosphate acyltransferase [Waterburya agarophytonicola]MCC0176125.1 1-acyl-sn-glycerol-3-phosphate acyltransferase [Waterburya agarophytonicola KI4]